MRARTGGLRGMLTRTSLATRGADEERGSPAHLGVAGEPRPQEGAGGAGRGGPLHVEPRVAGLVLASEAGVGGGGVHVASQDRLHGDVAGVAHGGLDAALLGGRGQLERHAGQHDPRVQLTDPVLAVDRVGVLPEPGTDRRAGGEAPQAQHVLDEPVRVAVDVDRRARDERVALVGLHVELREGVGAAGRAVVQELPLQGEGALVAGQDVVARLRPARGRVATADRQGVDRVVAGEVAVGARPVVAHPSRGPGPAVGGGQVGVVVAQEPRREGDAPVGVALHVQQRGPERVGGAAHVGEDRERALPDVLRDARAVVELLPGPAVVDVEDRSGRCAADRHLPQGLVGGRVHADRGEVVGVAEEHVGGLGRGGLGQREVQDAGGDVDAALEREARRLRAGEPHAVPAAAADALDEVRRVDLAVVVELAEGQRVGAGECGAARLVVRLLLDPALPQGVADVGGAGGGEAVLLRHRRGLGPAQPGRLATARHEAAGPPRDVRERERLVLEGVGVGVDGLGDGRLRGDEGEPGRDEGESGEDGPGRARAGHGVLSSWWPAARAQRSVPRPLTCAHDPTPPVGVVRSGEAGPGTGAAGRRRARPPGLRTQGVVGERVGAAPMYREELE